jgi:pimeloyl-ACP methyl ester carboxylesterase
MVAARVPGIRFVVVVSAPGLPPGDNAAHRDSSLLAAKGFDAADIKRTVSLDRRLQKWLRDGEDRAELEALLVESSTTPWQRESSIPARLPAGPVPASWDWQGRTLDPAPAWAAVKVPVLAVYGAADDLLPPKTNAKAIERALRSGENKEVTVKTFPGANHCLREMPRSPNDKWEWPRAASGYLELVTGWMLERVHGQAASSDRP